MLNLEGSRVKIGDEMELPVKMDKGYIRMRGTVIWIHPQRRFFEVEFKTALGNIRECYPFKGDIES